MPKLRPAIRAILNRTRASRAELDALIKGHHGHEEPVEDIPVLAGRETQELGNNPRQGPSSHPPSVETRSIKRRDPSPVLPKRDNRNARRRQSAVRSAVPKDALIALFKTGMTVAQAAVQYPDIPKGTLVAFRANVTRGAYK